MGSTAGLTAIAWIGCALSNMGVKAEGTEFPAIDSCFVGVGFDLRDNCGKPPAMEVVPTCHSETPQNAACVEQKPFEEATSYTRDVRSVTAHQSLMTVIAGAEGGGWGVSASAGTEYMQQSHVTEESQAFFVGQSGRTGVHTLRNPSNMKLTQPARMKLINDPKGFLDLYGLHYVYAVTFGGSFLGSFTVNSRTSETAHSLSAFAKVSASKMFFSASASASFSDTCEDMSENIDVSSDARWVGGKDIKLDPSSPETMGKTFLQWENTLRQNPVPLVVVLREWIDSEDVQSIIMNQSAEIRNLFAAPILTEVARDDLTKENGLTSVVRESLNRALAWPTVTQNQTLRQSLQGLLRRVDAHAVELGLLSEADALARQGEIERQNSTWFVAPRLLDEFNALTAGVPSPKMQIYAVGYDWHIYVQDLDSMTADTKFSLVNSERWWSLAFSGDVAYLIGDDKHLYKLPLNNLGGHAERLREDRWQSNRIFGNTWYGVGDDCHIYKLPLASIKQGHSEKIDDNCWRALAFDDNGVMWAVASNLHIYRKDVAWTMVHSDRWISIQINDGLLWGVGDDRQLYAQPVSKMSLGSPWTHMNPKQWNDVAFLPEHTMVERMAATAARPLTLFA